MKIQKVASRRHILVTVNMYLLVELTSKVHSKSKHTILSQIFVCRCNKEGVCFSRYSSLNKNYLLVTTSCSYLHWWIYHAFHIFSARILFLSVLLTSHLAIKAVLELFEFKSTGLCCLVPWRETYMCVFEFVAKVFFLFLSK